MKKNTLFNILAIFLVFPSCSPRQVLAPVDDRQAPPGTKVSVHIVAPGETLYSIAWRYNLNYELLAKANGIDRSYRIYPGQRINLKLSSSRPTKAPDTRGSSVAKVAEHESSKSKVGVSQQTDRLKNQTPLRASVPAIVSAPTWQWPYKGRILRRFNGKSGLNKGIDIGGELGEPVFAASSGTVVYAGEGLRGYGKLIIIKHSDDYLSAYAHSRKLHVKEGDSVAMGEKIAELGRSGTNTVKLHFEIRFDGQPVDPLRYLPPN